MAAYLVRTNASGETSPFLVEHELQRVDEVAAKLVLDGFVVVSSVNPPENAAKEMALFLWNIISIQVRDQTQFN